jgi:hypothetical protein
MNFLDREKLRYKTVKGQLFPLEAQSDGTYNNKPRQFCLADGYADHNLHGSIRESSVEYFQARRMSWHAGRETDPESLSRSPSNHLCCSQCACVNALAPMMRDADLLANVFRNFFPDLGEPLRFDADDALSDGTKPFLAFEWIGTQNYLGEVGGRTRGANATSADFAFRFVRRDQKIQLVLGEWKYTERYTKKLESPEKLNKTRLRTYRAAFDRWNSIQPKLPPYEAFFSEPFYQLMRLTLLAQEMERAKANRGGEMGADVVSVLHITPAANKEFASSFTSKIFKNHGNTVLSAWASLAPEGRFQSIASEELFAAIMRHASPVYSDWSNWLTNRYGW